MDSTLLLHQKAMDKRNKVIALSVPNFSNKGQVKNEKKHRKQLLEKMKLSNIDHHEINVSSNINIEESWQMPLWLSVVLPYVRDGDVVNMAYISSDGFDFWHNKAKLITAFNAFMRLSGKKAKLRFPLQAYTKGHVIKELKKLKLLRDCWYCGSPKKGKPCGKCMKCLSVKRWTKYPESGISV